MLLGAKVHIIQLPQDKDGHLVGVAGQVALQTVAHLHQTLVPCNQQVLGESHVIGREDKVDYSVHNLERRTRCLFVRLLV